MHSDIIRPMPHNCMILDSYISLRGLLLHGFVSPSTGTQDGKLSVGLLRNTAKHNNGKEI